MNENNKLKCENLIKFLNKKFKTDTKEWSFGISIYKPDHQNRIKLVKIFKSNGGEQDLSLNFFSWSSFYDGLYMLNNVLEVEQ